MLHMVQFCMYDRHPLYWGTLTNALLESSVIIQHTLKTILHQDVTSTCRSTGGIYSFCSVLMDRLLKTRGIYLIVIVVLIDYTTYTTTNDNTRLCTFGHED